VREIARGVYQLRVLGAHVWLLSDEPLTLVDTGTRGSGGAILRALARLGHSPQALRWVVLTHYHPDHLGALPELLRACPRLRVAIHAAEAPYLARPARLPNPVAADYPALRAVVQRVWPLVRLRRACPVHARLVDGAPLPDRPAARVVHLPGHTPGSLAVHLLPDGLVLAGDALERRGGVLGPPGRPFTDDMATAHASIARLGSMDFGALALSHWPLVPRGAARAVRTLAERLAAAAR
jgi:glyoxylase-like metal-dependent hydrolase (beta-lactamase superfamily II)